MNGQWTRSGVHWCAEANAWPISRPKLQADWADPRQFYVALSWGTPGCDPVWSIEYHRTISERVGKIVDRWYDRKDRYLVP